MNPSTQALLKTVASTDATLTPAERQALASALSGGHRPPGSAAGALLVNQKEAARLLGMSRVTVWRLTVEGVFALVEVRPGTFRYRREEIEAFAERGIARPRAVPRRRSRRASSLAR